MVAESGEVVVVPADVFRARVLTDPLLSDTVLEAFLARRTALMSAAADTLQIIGSEYTPASMALREYAARNRLPHHWIDADTHPDIAVLLDGLGVTAADLPIAITQRGLLKRATPGELALPARDDRRRAARRAATTSSSSAPGRPGSPPRCTPRRRACAR